MKNQLLLTFAAAALALTSCTKAPVIDATPLTGIDAIQVPAGFNWASSHTVNLTATITDTRFQNSLFTVTVYDGDPGNGGSVLSNGAASLLSPYKSSLYLANQMSRIYVVKTAPDNSRTVQAVALTSENIAVTLSANGGTVVSQPGAQLLGAKLAGTDSDGDGVQDSQDAYPNDATKAYNTYYPSSSSFATVAFEDQWPKKGDYDMNDLVLGYQYIIVTNANNVVTQIRATYSLNATGGTSAIGFGVLFPFTKGTVSNVTGATLEAGQSKSVIIVFSNMRSEMATWNTQPGITQTAAKTYNVSFDIASGPNIGTLSVELHNPFIYSTNKRSVEVHLPGEVPTDLADLTLFGTGDDNSNVAAGRYYVTKAGLPYGISIPTTFNYPTETTDITKAFLHIGEWVSSNGSKYPDWYSNTGSGYRDAASIYTK